MRIAIDARAWNWTGVGRYIRALVREYAHLVTPHTFVLLMPDDPAAIAEAKELTKLHADAFSFQTIGGSYYSWSEQLQLPFQLANIQADLFHFPHFNVPLFFTRPYVVTIHDTTRFYFPGQKRQGLVQQLAYELVFTQAVRRAKRVICVSDHTAHELQSLRAALSAVSVIHEGVDERFLANTSKEESMRVQKLLGTRDPYLLMVGVWMSHKNIPRVLRAFQVIHAKYPNLKLVVTGMHRPGYVDVTRLVRDFALQDSVILPGFVRDVILPTLYKQARALLFASLYEGFGLPALEAAAAGTPVIASNVSSLPEIMGSAAQYVNPENKADIARGIEAVLMNDNWRAQLIASGKRRASVFSWEVCARKTLAVYEMHKPSSEPAVNAA